MDFLEVVGADVALNIFMRLDDPIDLIRASVVSQFWRDFVIAHSLVKHLCLKIFPQLSCISHIFVCDIRERNKMKIVHKVHASLLEARLRSKVYLRNCIAYELTRSGEPDFGREVGGARGYFRDTPYSWCGKQPVALTYSLEADVSIVTQVHIQPDERVSGHPIRYVESLRIGYLKSPSQQFDQTKDQKAWTYTSPVFPMKMENGFQMFKLSEPLLCIGRFLLIELLGRHKEPSANPLFYMRIRCVRILGLPLEPAFGIKFLQGSGRWLLTYHPQCFRMIL